MGATTIYVLPTGAPCQLTSPPRELPTPSLDLEAKLLIQVHGGRIVRPHFELDAPQAEPIVGQVDHRCHQCRANAPVLKIIVHRHAALANISPAWTVLYVESQIADNSSVNAGNKRIHVGSRLAEPCAVKFERPPWDLQRVRHHARTA